MAVDIDTLQIGDTVRFFLDRDGGHNIYGILTCQEDITPKSSVLLGTIIRQDRGDFQAPFIVGMHDQRGVASISGKMDVDREFVGAKRLAEKKTHARRSS